MDRTNVSWLRSWAEDLPLSRKLDAAVTLLRGQVEAQAAAASDPKQDLLRRAEALFEAAKAGQAADPEDVARLLEAVLEGMD